MLSIENVTASNLTRALRLAGTRGLYLAFTAEGCIHCGAHEAEWGAYADFAAITTTTVPGIVRVDGDRDRALLRRYEVEELPALLLAWNDRWTTYAGVHERAAMATFGAAQLAPVTRELHSMDELLEILREQKEPWPLASDLVGSSTMASERRATEAATESLPAQQPPTPPPAAPSPPPPPLLLLGFFGAPHDEEAEELDDFARAAAELRKLRTDVAVRAAYVTLDAAIRSEFISRRGWVRQAPSAVLLVGARVSRAVHDRATGAPLKVCSRTRPYPCRLKCCAIDVPT